MLNILVISNDSSSHTIWVAYTVRVTYTVVLMWKLTMPKSTHLLYLADRRQHGLSLEIQVAYNCYVERWNLVVVGSSPGLARVLYVNEASCHKAATQCHTGVATQRAWRIEGTTDSLINTHVVPLPLEWHNEIRYSWNLTMEWKY